MTQQTPTNPKHLLLLADVCLIVVAALWGASYGVAKQSLQFYPVLGFLFIRFGLTCLILVPIWLFASKKCQLRIKSILAVAAPLGVLMFIVFICETYGVFYTSAANAAILVSLCLIITPFFEWFFLQAKPRRLIFICALISLTGTYLLTTQSGKLLRVTLNTGDSLILLAAVARALLVVLTKKRVTNKLISAIDLTLIQTSVVFLGSVFLFVASTITSGDTFTIPKQPIFWLSALFLVLFCTIFAFFVQNWAIKIGTPSRASLLMGSEPVFGALFAVLVFGEQMSVQGWIGGALITISSLLVIMR